MKRLVIFSLFVASNINAAAPAPPPIPAALVRTPPAGVAPTPAARIVPTPPVGIAPTPAARIAPTPPAGIAPTPPVTHLAPTPPVTVNPTPTIPGIVEFAAQQRAFAQQVARERRASGHPAWTIPIRTTTTPSLGGGGTPPPAVPAPAVAPGVAGAAAAPAGPPIATPGIPAAPIGQHMLDVINNTPNELQLFLRDSANQLHQQTLPAGDMLISIQIFDNTQSAYVQSIGACEPVSIANGVTGIVINPATAGTVNYEITALMPTYEHYVLVYNQSPNAQLAVLDIEVPKSGLMGFLPGFMGGTHTLKIFKLLTPGQTGLLEVPQIASSISATNAPTRVVPASVQLYIPTSQNPNHFLINTTQHNTFVVTQNEDVRANI